MYNICSFISKLKQSWLCIISLQFIFFGVMLKYKVFKSFYYCAIKRFVVVQVMLIIIKNTCMFNFDASYYNTFSLFSTFYLPHLLKLLKVYTKWLFMYFKMYNVSYLVNKFHEFIKQLYFFLTICCAYVNVRCVYKHTLKVDILPFKLPEFTVDIPTFCLYLKQQKRKIHFCYIG